MTADSLSDAQQALVTEPPGFFAAACPGAGKTRAMVARFLKRTAEEPRRGIALVSFSNAAVNEVERRCTDQAESLAAPHFVGTFDAFLHRFIVTPLYVKTYAPHPRYVRSWQEIPAARFRVPDLGQAPDFELEWFSFDADGRAQLDMTRVPSRFSSNVRKLLAKRQHAAEQRATDRFRELLAAGIVSCDAARWLAVRWLTNPPTRRILTQLLRERFSEIIVDEAQDCGQEELAVLRFLRDCGIGIVLVGDMDQSIYEFRSATPTAVRDFTADFRPLPLMDNWRSSPAICAFNTSLRAGWRTETARGSNSTNVTYVQLIEFSHPGDIAPAALDIADQHHLAASDLMLISHAEITGMNAVGATRTAQTGNRVHAIAEAGVTLRSTASTERARQSAIEQVERTVAAALARGRSSIDHGLDATCTVLGISRRWLRGFAVRMAVALEPEGKTRQQFASDVRDYLHTAHWDGMLPPESATLTNLFKAPPEQAWTSLARGRNKPSIPYSTVHGVKGTEFRGVVLVLPHHLRKDALTHRTVLDDWEGDHDTEPRRVLYVAGSRARELLICAAHHSHITRVEKLLAAGGVPYSRL